MNKILRYSFMSMLMLFAGSVMADDVVIDFNAMTDLAVSHDAVKDEGGNVTEEASTAGDITEAKTITVNGVEVTISPAEEGKTVNRFWRTNNGPQLRCYSGTITIKAGQNMKSITFAAPSKFNLTAAEGTIEGKAWSGDAAEVVFTVAGNTQMNKITVSFDASSTPDNPHPTGKGSLEDPFTVAEAIAFTSALAADAKSDVNYYIKGKVSSIKYTFSAQYGTATFNISDDGQAANEFTCYGVYYLENKSWVDGNTQVAVGDEVIVCGKVVNYKGTTPETANKEAYIYSLNGKTKNEGGSEEPVQVERITVAKALEIIAGLEGENVSADTYEIEGYVVSLTEAFNPQYGNYTLNMGDTPDATTTLYVYRAKNANNEKFTEDVIKVGDKIVVKAKLVNYKGNTPETNNAIILTVNGQSTGINDVKANNFQNNGLMYNIAGQVVNKGYKGLVIMNGRKFVNK